MVRILLQSHKRKMQRTLLHRSAARKGARAGPRGGPRAEPQNPENRFLVWIFCFFGPLGMPEASWGRWLPAQAARARMDELRPRSCPKL